MSNGEQQTASLPALGELQNRLGDQAPAWAIPHLIAVENLDLMMSDARDRVNFSHKVEAHALGAAELLPASEDDDEMSSRTISVQGDTVNHIYQGAPAAVAPAATLPAPAATVLAATAPAVASGLKKWGVPLLCTALGAGGLGGGVAIYNWFHQAAPAVSQAVDSAWKLGVSVKNHE